MKKKAPLKDPKGGLTAAGRKQFAKKEGSRLRPGVKGAANTPEKMRRKGSFLRRHFAHPRGPMRDENGNPTRLALSAHAWGEAVPKTLADAKTLAAKGSRLLARYAKTAQAAAKKTRSATKKASTKKRASGAKKRASGAKKRASGAKKNSLVANINRRKKSGTSRPKSAGTVSRASYSEMRKGWPHSKRRKASKKTARKKK